MKQTNTRQNKLENNSGDGKDAQQSINRKIEDRQWSHLPQKKELKSRSLSDCTLRLIYINN